MVDLVTPELNNMKSIFKLLDGSTDGLLPWYFYTTVIEPKADNWKIDIEPERLETLKDPENPNYQEVWREVVLKAEWLSPEFEKYRLLMNFNLYLIEENCLKAIFILLNTENIWVDFHSVRKVNDYLYVDLKEVTDIKKIEAKLKEEIDLNIVVLSVLVNPNKK